jgi:hypothetical protein
MTSFSSINNANNFFFSSVSGPIVTGCGVALSECYKTGADPGFKPYCCRGSFTADLLDPSSLSLNPYPISNSVSFNSPPLTAFSYTAQAMYCDSSWTAGAPTCDVYLQDYCYNQVVTRDFQDGKGVQTIHAVLDSQHPCGQWYAGIMNDYATNLFTRRNIDIIDNIFTQYCATGGLASQVNDSQSCLCINSFLGNGIYYTSNDGLGGYPVVGASSRTDADILFTDPLCGSIMCRTDPAYFTFTANEVNLEGTTNQFQRDHKARKPVFIVSSDFIDRLKPGQSTPQGMVYYNQKQNNSLNHIKINLVVNHFKIFNFL